MSETPDSQRLMEYDAMSKSPVLTYILWFFLGFLGGHRMYAGRVPSGLIMLAVWGIGTITTFILIGWAFLALWFIWWVVDAFLIPGWIRDYNLGIARRLSR